MHMLRRLLMTMLLIVPALGGAQRQRRMIDTGASLAEIYAATVEETRATYPESAKALCR